jgi:hypothetical protein
MSPIVEDDPTILDDDLLLRRVPLQHFIWDAENQFWRPSSAAFEDHPTGSPMSVVLASMLAAGGRGLESAVAGFAGFALAAISVEMVRNLGLGVVRKPLPEESAHAEVTGKKSKSIRKKLAVAAIWIVPPNTAKPIP